MVDTKALKLPCRIKYCLDKKTSDALMPKCNSKQIYTENMTVTTSTYKGDSIDINEVREVGFEGVKVYDIQRQAKSLLVGGYTSSWNSDL